MHLKIPASREDSVGFANIMNVTVLDLHGGLTEIKYELQSQFKPNVNKNQLVSLFV